MPVQIAVHQILTLTVPMVGNYGVPDPNRMDEFGLPKGFESYKIHAAGLVVQDYSHHYSHWDAHSSLGDWLKKEGIPAISGIDTRLLTKKIRSRGAMLGRIELENVSVLPEPDVAPPGKERTSDTLQRDPTTVREAAAGGPQQAQPGGGGFGAGGASLRQGQPHQGACGRGCAWRCWRPVTPRV